MAEIAIDGTPCPGSARRSRSPGTQRPSMVFATSALPSSAVIVSAAKQIDCAPSGRDPNALRAALIHEIGRVGLTSARPQQQMSSKAFAVRFADRSCAPSPARDSGRPARSSRETPSNRPISKPPSPQRRRARTARLFRRPPGFQFARRASCGSRHRSCSGTLPLFEKRCHRQRLLRKRFEYGLVCRHQRNAEYAGQRDKLAVVRRKARLAE